MRALCLSALLLLAGCATTPTTSWLDPSAPAVTQASSLVPVRFDFQDNRNSQAVIQLAKSSLTNDPGLDQRLSQSLREGLTAKGYSIQPATGPRLSVRLLTLQAVVEEGLVSHKSQQQVVMEVYAERDGQTLTKRFTSTGSFEAPLGPDIGRLEEELNRLLEKTMTALVNDPEITRLFAA
ncbi:YajG family lipoprotein [Gallaecimonas kandeliae]|uniref:YajG family lipoprotein n=1 Tax=Gallaecimonas kandeliae TaxID=3029055 RepID=UPI0026472046|nr:YajG family lipoprotein [Gallaecimonas kandeliae]WKE64896.1 YajG family lipoprotein [Gallaecimonas kandeliae]